MNSADKNQCEYGDESDDGVIGLVPYGFNSDSESSCMSPSVTKRRKKRDRVEGSAWFSAKNKKRRETGKSFLGKQKVNNGWNYKKKKEARTLKERCHCKKTITMKCAQITDDDRKEIFTRFWKMSWD